MSPSELLLYKGELTDIGLTSLQFVSFIVKLEQAFDIEILDSDLLISKFITIDMLFGTLEKYFTTSESMKKCLILDADGVLWKGISGEDDILIDKEVLAFQSLILKLYERGVLLCVCSKNEKFLIDTSFAKPNMILKKENFVLIVANRENKEKNIRNIANELNLPLDSMVFIDDSDYELGFVSANLPEVMCIKFNYSDMSTIEFVASIFSSVAPTSDLNRTRLYVEQKGREKERAKFASIEEYNKSLMTKVIVEKPDEKCIDRLVELSARTHQFNLSAKSYTAKQLRYMLANDEYNIFALRVSDKYGDMGIVGMTVERQGTIEAFMLSCRAFDRGLELALLEKLKATNVGMLRGLYTPTDKNQRFAKFYLDNGVDII